VDYADQLTQLHSAHRILKEQHDKFQEDLAALKPAHDELQVGGPTCCTAMLLLRSLSAR